MSDAPAPAKIVFTTGFARRYTAGQREFDIVAKTLRDVLKELDRQFPGLGEVLEDETGVAINGDLHEVGYVQPVPPGAEVFFIPKIEGG